MPNPALQSEAYKALDEAKKVLGKDASDLQRKAYAHAFASAKLGMNILQNNAKASKALSMANNFYATGLKIGQMADKGFSADASGIIGISTIANGAVATITDFFELVGAPGVGRAVAEVGGWAQVGLGCAAGFAAGGGGASAVTAAVGCSFSFISKLMSMFKGAPPQAQMRADQERARLFPFDNTVAQAMVIDAARVAAVLKGFYGVQSYDGIANRLKLEFDGTSGKLMARDSTTYLWGTYPREAAEGQRQKAVPAFDLKQLMYVLSPGTNIISWRGCDTRTDPAACNAWHNLNNAFAFVSMLAMHKMQGIRYLPGGRDVFARTNWDSDISVDVIELGAKIAREQIGKKQAPVITTDILCLTFGNEAYFRCDNKYDKPRVTIDMSPFLIADELIEYFAAVTIRELAENVQITDKGETVPMLSAYARHGLPVRWRVVGGLGNTKGDPKQNLFNDSMMSNFPDDWRKSMKRSDISEIITKAISGDARALKQLGLLRLISAMSYLHMQYRFSSHRNIQRIENTLNDMVDKLEANSAGATFAEVENPVNPRQAVNMGAKWRLNPINRQAKSLAAEIGFRNAQINAVRKAGQGRAMRVALSPAMHKGASAREDFRYIADRFGDQISTVAALRQRCEAAGGSQVQIGQKYYCVAPGETVGQAMARQGDAQKKGSGTAALLAAAAAALLIAR